MRIAYVEDNPANMALVRRVAQLGKHNVDGFVSAEEALGTLLDAHYELILVDIQLQGEMDGLALTRVLRNHEIETPVVAVTAFAMVGDRERCLEAGCNHYMAKPLPVPELVALFNRYENGAA